MIGVRCRWPARGHLVQVDLGDQQVGAAAAHRHVDVGHEGPRQEAEQGALVAAGPHGAESEPAVGIGLDLAGGRGGAGVPACAGTDRNLSSRVNIEVRPTRVDFHCTPVWAFNRISARSSNDCAAM